MGEQALKSHMKGKKHIKNAETIQCFFRPTKKANDNNEISTVHMPNSSQIQTKKTKETQQLTLSFVFLGVNSLFVNMTWENSISFYCEIKVIIIIAIIIIEA